MNLLIPAAMLSGSPAQVEFLEAVAKLGGKVFVLGDGLNPIALDAGVRIVSMPKSVEQMIWFLEAEHVSCDETVFLASNPDMADLAKAARLKIGVVGQNQSGTTPDETWADFEAAQRWFEKMAQLSKRAWPIATVGGLVFAPDQTALFVRTAKWGGTWGVPGGKIDYGEPHLQAFLREIQEETGLVALEPKFVLIQDAIEEPEFFRPRHFLLLNYIARCESKSHKLNHESLEGGWFSLNDALALGLNRPTRHFVEHLLDCHNKI